MIDTKIYPELDAMIEEVGGVGAVMGMMLHIEMILAHCKEQGTVTPLQTLRRNVACRRWRAKYAEEAAEAKA